MKIQFQNKNRLYKNLLVLLIIVPCVITAWFLYYYCYLTLMNSIVIIASEKNYTNNLYRSDISEIINKHQNKVDIENRNDFNINFE